VTPEAGRGSVNGNLGCHMLNVAMPGNKGAAGARASCCPSESTFGADTQLSIYSICGNCRAPFAQYSPALCLLTSVTMSSAPLSVTKPFQVGQERIQTPIRGACGGGLLAALPKTDTCPWHQQASTVLGSIENHRKLCKWSLLTGSL
jgi:hypothetical protein